MVHVSRECQLYHQLSTYKVSTSIIWDVGVAGTVDHQAISHLKTWEISVTPLRLCLSEETLTIGPFYLMSMSLLPGVYVPSTWCLFPFYLVSMSLLPGVYVPSTLVSMSLLPGVYVPSTWCLCPFYLVSMSLLPGVYVPSTWCLCPFYLVSMSLLSGVYAMGSKRSHTGGKCVTCRGLKEY